MSKDAVLDDLKDLQSDWGDAEANEGFFQLPDGEYAVRIVDADLDYSQNNNLIATLTLKVLEGEHKGKEVKKFWNMKPESFPYIKGDLKRLGIEFPKKLSNFRETLDNEVMDLAVMVKIQKQKNDPNYQNIYFNELYEDAEPEEEKPARPVREARKPAKEEEPEESNEIEEGSEVEFKDGKKMMSGKVDTINEKKGTADVDVTLDNGDEETWTVDIADLSIKPIEAEPVKKTTRRPSRPKK